MMIFSEYTNVVRLISDKIASYSVSLLDVGKSSHMACSILSPVGALSCKLTPSPVCQEALSTLRIHHPELSGSASCLGNLCKQVCGYLPL